MTTSRGFNTNDYHNGMSFHDLDEVERPIRRFSPIHLRSDNQEYQPRQIRNDDQYRAPESKRSNFCSKPCLIGLCIGLLIGIALVIAIAVPIGVTKTCESITCATASTTSCPSTTTSSTQSCIGIISSTPNWTGTFLMDNGCLTTSCCCLYNQITVSQIIGNQMQITGSVTGQCTNIGSIASIPIPMPTTFQTLFSWGGVGIRLQLGQDNSYLSFVNTANAYCSATALRTS